ITAGLYAWQQRGQAIEQRHAARVALAREIAAHSNDMIDSDPQLAALWAIAAYRLDPEREERDALTAVSLRPLGRRLTGHTGPVTAVAFSPDGTTLATISLDNTARLWNARTGRPIATLTGHTGTVTAVAFSPDGTTLATASDDRTARLWNA